ncbi:hypothetical protein [Fluviicola sp.]|jgi:exoribonuclease II|uniref:hypothetical protein n=1 Tax=Fluviicola sp. TaxID=1917219 RepID=UPI002825F5E3|nr:hypothetical protein [Fluviicola sp.]MDR0800912.1 hypothetical protein [Fluviicola sp.]
MEKRRKRATKDEMEANYRLICEKLVGDQMINANIALAQLGSKYRVQFTTVEPEKEKK